MLVVREQRLPTRYQKESLTTMDSTNSLEVMYQKLKRRRFVVEQVLENIPRIHTHSIQKKKDWEMIYPESTSHKTCQNIKTKVGTIAYPKFC